LCVCMWVSVPVCVHNTYVLCVLHGCVPVCVYATTLGAHTLGC
jgi:hypothetical protein